MFILSDIDDDRLSPHEKRMIELERIQYRIDLQELIEAGLFADDDFLDDLYDI